MAEWDHRWLLGGGIGSGKSIVREQMETAGIATIDSDSVGHEVLAPDGAAHAAVAAEWPEAVKDGQIVRSILGEIVFSDWNQLKRLESITHPHIFGMISRRVEEIDGAVVVEIPLISAPLDGTWRLIVVDAEDEKRLQRAVSRGMSPDRARDVMSSQPGRSEWLAKADLVIPNHHDLEDLAETVDLVIPRL